MHNGLQNYLSLYKEDSFVKIIREHNKNTEQRIKKNLLSYLIIIGIAIAIIISIAGLVSFSSVKIFGLIFILALPILHPILKIINPAKEDEVKLKYKIMDNLLNIFGKFEWNYEKFDENKMASYKETAVFPQSYIKKFDDNIYGFYKNDIEVMINEFQTERNSVLTALAFAVPVFFGILLFGLISFIFIIIFITIVSTIFNGSAGWSCNDSNIFLCKILFAYPLIIFALAFIVPLVMLWSGINRGNFQGVVVDCKFPKKFKGKTIVFENGFTNKNVNFNKLTTLTQTKLEDLEFNKSYKLYTNNQVDSRYIFTPSFIERFKQCKNTLNAKYIRAEFYNNKMFLFIQTDRDLFSINQYKQIKKSDIDRVFAELVSLFELIDELKLDSETGL